MCFFIIIINSLVADTNDVYTISLDVAGRNYFIKTSIILNKGEDEIKIPLILTNYQFLEKSLYKEFISNNPKCSNFFKFRGWQRLINKIHFKKIINISGIEMEFHDENNYNKGSYFIYIDNLIIHKKDNTQQILYDFNQIDLFNISIQPTTFTNLNYGKKIVLKKRGSEDKALGIKIFDRLEVDKLIIRFNK